MDVTSVASSLYNQYQNLVDRFQSGEVGYQKAFSDHSQLVPKTRDLIGVGTLTGDLEGRSAQVNVPLDVMQQIQSYLSETHPGNATDHQVAASSYAKTLQAQGGEAAVSWAANKVIVPLMPTSISEMTLDRQTGGFMSDIRIDFNVEAHDFLSSYAQKNKAAWSNAASELGISFTWGAPFNAAYYNIPEGGGVDISAGTPNSEAEKIFRHIASDTEAAEFDQHMAPKRQELEARITERIGNLLEWTNQEMDRLSSPRAALEEAGLTAENMSAVMLKRNQDGSYSVSSQTEKASEIEAVINSTPQLRAYYDGAWKEAAL